MEKDRALTVFKENAEKLLAQYRSKRSYLYSDFNLVWTLTNFDIPINGFKKEEAEKSFIQSCLNYAVHTFTNSCCIYTQIGAFYLLYKIHYCYNYFKEKTKIKLTLSEFKVLKHLVETAKDVKEEGYEFLYVFAKMKCNDDFFYVAFDEKALNLSRKKMIDNKLPDETVNTLLKESGIQKLAKIDKVYDKCLKQYLDKNPDVMFSMNQEPSIINQLEDINKSDL